MYKTESKAVLNDVTQAERQERENVGAIIWSKHFIVWFGSQFCRDRDCESIHKIHLCNYNAVKALEWGIINN